MFADPASHCTAPLRSRAVAIVVNSLLMLSLGVAAADGQAASTMSQGSGATATLDFKIVIPSVLMLDTKSGTVYSNDARFVALLGTTEAPDGHAAIVRVANAARGAVAAVNEWNRGAKRGTPGGRMATRPLANGDVVCIP